MGIALSLQQYLDDQHIDYDVMVHERTRCSSRTAEVSHVPGDCLAKAVVLTREGGYVLAVVPASCRVQLDAIQQMLHCPVGMASEEEIATLFPDCDVGAVPPVGAPYALEAIVDDSLDRQGDIYLEGGDHRSLIHIRGPQFRDLMKDMPRGRIAVHM
jgi:Ala-tRNA(Pro) deacylase